MSRLKEIYESEIKDAMVKKFGYKNLSVEVTKSTLKKVNEIKVTRLQEIIEE